MSQTITIGELNPNVRGNFTLKFEVAEIGPPLAKPQQIQCKLVDETGCIDAYFSNLGKFIKVGGVYQLTSFKCKVVEHSLRVQQKKDSKLTRIKAQFNFKDLFNNLSEKFYASKPVQKNNASIENQIKGSKNEEIKNVPQKNQEEIKNEQKEDNKQIKASEKIEANNKSQKYQNLRSQNDRKRSSYQKREQKTEPNKNQPQKKKVYVQKQSKQDNLVRDNQNLERHNPQQRTLLKNIYKFQQKRVNLIVRIRDQTKIDCGDYQLIKVSDSTGSVFAQFHLRVDIQENNWYSLKNFKVYEDQQYGFVIVQTKKSSLEVVYDFDEKPNFKLIDFQKK